MLAMVDGEYIFPFGSVSPDVLFEWLFWYGAIGFVVGPFIAWHLCSYWYRDFKEIRPGDVLNGLVVWLISIPGWTIFILFLGLVKITESPFWSKGYKVGKKK